MIIPLGIMARQNDLLKHQVQQQFTLPPTPTLAPTATPTTKPTTKSTNRAVQPTTDPDPPVHCNISEQCGGGSKPLKQSECNSRTCCETKDGWKYIEKKECEALHGSYNAETQKKADRIPVFVGGVTYNCDASAETAVKDAYNAYINSWEQARVKAKTCTYGTSADIEKCVNAYYGMSTLYYETFSKLTSQYCS